MQPITVEERQTVIDVAMQATGSVEAFFEIALLNGISPTDEPAAGTVFLTPAVVAAADVVNAFATQNKKPASAEPKITIAPEDELSGIDYWIIGEDFVVSE